MRLSKNGEFVELANEIHVAAYKAKGWVEVAEAEQVEEAIEVEETETEEAEQVAEDGEPDEAEQVEEKPKRGRKAKTE